MPFASFASFASFAVLQMFYKCEQCIFDHLWMYRDLTFAHVIIVSLKTMENGMNFKLF